MRIEPIDITVGADDEGVASGLRGRRYHFDRPGPRVLVTACLHGDEVTSTGALWYLADRLAESTLGGSATLIPCVNQLGARLSTRHIPLETSDLNRQFPGRADGSLGERLAAALVELLGEHDALIDVHTAGWSTCFVLLDHIVDPDLDRRVIAWAASTGLPVIGEMPAAQSNLQGLDRSWSAWACRIGKPAVTIELAGFHRLETKAARRGADAVLAMMEAVPHSDTPVDGVALKWRRAECYAGSGGLFETDYAPDDRVARGERIGVVRSLQGEIRETVTARSDGFIIALQPVSAVQVGSWLATLAVPAE
jgi:predicted deacylase